MGDFSLWWESILQWLYFFPSNEWAYYYLQWANFLLWWGMILSVKYTTIDK